MNLASKGWTKGMVVVCFVACLAVAATVNADMITLGNSSFETPVTGGYTAGIGSPWIPGGTGSTGTWNNDMGGTTDGENVQLLILGTTAQYVHIRQEIPTTEAVVAGNTRYTLTALIGKRAGFTGAPTIDLLVQAKSGTTYTDLTLVSQTGSYGTAGSMSEWTAVFDVPTNLIGQQLVARIQAHHTDYSAQIAVDKVSLTSVPEPATLSLLCAGGALTALRRRRSK